MRHLRPAPLVLATVSATALGLLGSAPATQADPGPAAVTTTGHSTPDATRVGRLTNLDHLDFLSDTVTPPHQEGHTTYRLEEEPAIGTLWTYADRQEDGTFRRVGGGPYDEATDTWGQGAFNADDVARAAVVYLRHWRQTSAASSRDAAYEMLRGLTYLQTTEGEDAGNVVLWMQPDGTLNPSPEPVELPDPSDSDASSYWVARTVWALGEGYAAFRKADPDFAAFLRDRMELTLAAIERDVLVRDGQLLRVDGRRTPAWLLADGADASAEAMLGLVAYQRAGGSSAGAHVLARLTEGVTRMSGGDAQRWPRGGVLPWARSRSLWHAWASQMPAALARAGRVLGVDAATRAARRDSFTFTPWLLTSGGPDNGRAPSRVDAVQIAYGVDSRLQSLLATGGPAARGLAGITAAWYFGANAAGERVYDPATGVTVDGIEADGRVNRNSGAESTIHALLSMLALDAHPAVRRMARIADARERLVPTLIEGEDGDFSGDADVVEPESLWTGEASYSGRGYALLRGSSTATYAVRDALGGGPARLVPVVDLRHGSTGRLILTGRGGQRLGVVRAGDIGPSADSAGPGALLPVALADGVLGRRTARVVATARSGETRLDALQVQPLITLLVLGGDGHGTALARSDAGRTRSARVELPGRGLARVRSYDGRGRLVARDTVRGRTIRVAVPPGGFTLVRR